MSGKLRDYVNEKQAVCELDKPYPHDLLLFTQKVCAQAIEDHQGKRKPKTGYELVRMFCHSWRLGHSRMAAAIYRKTRWSLEVAEEKATEQ